MGNGLGKLKTVLKDRCPTCGSHLQVRNQGEVSLGTRYFSEDEIVCINCGYTIPLQHEKRRIKNSDLEEDEY